MDRRFLLAMALIMAILLGPGLFRDPPPPDTGVDLDTLATIEPEPIAAPSQAPALEVPTTDTVPAIDVDTVVVTSDLYRFVVSTRGGRLISAVLSRYNYTIEGRQDEHVELFHPNGDFLAPRLLVGRDTVFLDDWVFTPSARQLTVDRPVELILRGAGQGLAVELRYRFIPETYYVEVSGAVTGLGPNGGLLLIGMGPGVANTEKNSSENKRNMGFVTRNGGSNLTRFSSLDPGESVTESGPFQWVAVKSKYFVTAVLATHDGAVPLSGVTASVAADAPKDPETAALWTSLPVASDGAYQFTGYAGPMEYPRLKAIGHGFDDVNPYGWPGLRTLIRPVAVAARWILVWMHETLNLHYGVVLILFGVLIRVVLWPLNQKAMRASLRMQAVQPLMKELQDKYKDQPEKLQKEMFKLYKEHNVNPLGGCWPMLLPFPVLIALFFVFQNTIELRGVSFMWLPDLAQPDPLYVIPLLMGVSMFFVSKVGQMGMEPNPQMKMMLYVMPVMMTVLFANFASGLNLYYTVQNLVSIPQQFWIAQERLKANPPKKAQPTEAPPADDGPGHPARPKQKKRKKRK
jgi:YidC/Oxa1 family membrane protein insertase